MVEAVNGCVVYVITCTCWLLSILLFFFLSS